MKRTILSNPMNRGRRAVLSLFAHKIHLALAFLALLALPFGARAQSDATLVYLVPSQGTLTPDFNSSNYTYTASVAFGTADVLIYALPADANATLRINGSLIAYGNPSPAINLSIGANVITNMVVSADATVTNTYLLTVTRSSAADLSSLTLSSGTLIPAFSSTTLSYNARVAYGSTIMNDPLPITVTATPSDYNATIMVNGSPVLPGNPSAPINLNVGVNVINVAVTGVDSSVRTYTINVTRDGPVGNPGFEARGTYAPLADGYDDYHKYASETWRQWQRAINGGPCRIWNPGVAGCGRQTTGSIDEGFGGNPAEGDYCMVVRSQYSDGTNYSADLVSGTNYYFEALAQILPVTFDPNMTYTLTVKVGRPPGSASYTANWIGYALQLAVGGVNVDASQYGGRVDGGTVFAEDINSATVPFDGWTTVKLRYRPNPANAGLAGQPLQIRLCSLEDASNLAGSGIVAFDDVRLEGDLVPVGDVTAPTLAGSNMVDDKGAATIPSKTMVTYTVSFSKPMDASTVVAAGFTNAGTASFVLGRINHVSGGVFTVQMTPTSTGTLRLAVPAGAVMTDVSGNPLDTSAAIVDNTTLNVTSEFFADGTWVLNSSDFWNNAVNWSNNIVANGTDRTAYFTADINPFNTIAINAPRTIGNITFTDGVSSHDMLLSGTSVLTLDRSSGAPVIDVTQTGRTLTFAGPITGSDGLVKNGAGTAKVRLAGTITGNTTINGGFLEIGMGNGTYDGNIAIAAGATLQYNVDDRKLRSQMTLNGVISGGGSLLKGGRTGLTLNNNNTYTGVTTLGGAAGGALLLNQPQSLPGGIATSGGISGLTFNGGVLGLGAGDFTRSLAAAGVSTGVNFTGNGGWAAYGADRVVNLGGASAQVVWATANTGFNGKVLILGSPQASTFQSISPAIIPSTHKLTLQNPLDLGTATRTVQVEDGLAEVDGELSGTLSGSGGLTKTGTGALALSGANTYTGATTVSAGKLFINGDQRAAAGAVSVAANAALGGTGVIGGDTTIADNGGLILTLGASPGTQAKLSLASGKMLTFSGASVLTLTSAGGSSIGTYVLLTAPGGIFGSVPATVNVPAGWTSDPPVIVNGTNLVLNVTAVPPATPPPAVLTNSVSGSTLSLSWPAGQGWRLQQQTNPLSVGLSSNWVYVTDSSVSSTNITLDLTLPATFYRLAHP